MTRFLNFIADESGAAAAEYSLILAFVAILIIFALENLGNGVANTFNAVNSALPAAS